jgi:hypothetical protein
MPFRHPQAHAIENPHVLYRWVQEIRSAKIEAISPDGPCNISPKAFKANQPDGDALIYVAAIEQNTQDTLSK